MSFLCLHCMHWDGTEHNATQQLTAPCDKRRMRTYADDTCAAFHDAAKPRRVTGMEHISTIMARVLDDIVREESEAA